MDKATERELLNAFDELGYKTTVISHDNSPIITLVLSSHNWVEFIIELSTRYQWVHNIYTIHGLLSATDLKRFEEAVFNAFRKDK